MAIIEVRNFDSPDETRPFEGKGRALFMTVAGKEIRKGVFEPGWRWSENVKPIAGTEWCEFAHLMYVVSGRMRIIMEDGSVAEVGSGDVVSVPPRHDAEVIGDEACVTVDIGDEDSDYAKWS